MSLSLREQLIQAGLVSKKQVKEANQQRQQQHKRQQQHRHQEGRKPEPSSEEKLATQRAQAAKIARDLELNRKQQEKAQRKARRAQIRQIIENERLPMLETEDFYNFTDGGKIHRIAVDAERRPRLIAGDLAIVRYSGFYAVVPAATALRIRELDEYMVVATVSTERAAAEDDPYKDFVVPDDLVW